MVSSPSPARMAWMCAGSAGPGSITATRPRAQDVGAGAIKREGAGIVGNYPSDTRRDLLNTAIVELQFTPEWDFDGHTESYR